MKMSDDTKAEMRFLQHLGMLSGPYISGVRREVKNGRLFDRKALLGMYIDASVKRKNWQGIDKNVVVGYAKSQLDKEIVSAAV